MKTYQTSEVARLFGIHPNTVRLYETLHLIPKVERQENSYRVFTDFHIAQFRLARLALQVEVMQNGLRKKIVQMVKTSASGDFDSAIKLTNEYILQIRQERGQAEEAVEIVRQILAGSKIENSVTLKRREVSERLNITMDTLRNWEMNGLLRVKRRENGYRIYTGEDVRRLKIIRSLRCANYSLEAILRLLNELSCNPDADMQTALNTPGTDDELISVCDRLIVSLYTAEKNALSILDMLQEMKTRFS